MKLILALSAAIAACCLLYVAGKPVAAPLYGEYVATQEISRAGKDGFKLVSSNEAGEGGQRFIFQNGGRQIDVFVRDGAVVRIWEGEACAGTPSR